MSWTRFFRRRQRMMDSLDQDIRDYIERETQDNIDRGMPPEEARYAALRKFGNVTRIKEETREVWSLVWLEQLGQDIRFGARMLTKNPYFTVVAVITLALGIGANTAIFTLIDAVQFRMLPVSSPRELLFLNAVSPRLPGVFVKSISANSFEDCRQRCPSFSYPFFEDVQRYSQAFSGVTAMATSSNNLNVGYKSTPSRADGQLVSGTFFATLGVRPMFGRMLTPEDDRAEANPVAVVSHTYWQRRLGGDWGVIGQTIVLNGTPFTVVGVAPPEFYGIQPGRAVEIWLSLHAGPRIEPDWWRDFADHTVWWVTIVGRLKPGVTRQQASAELGVLYRAALSSDIGPTTKTTDIPHLEVSSGSRGLRYLQREFSRPLLILMVMVALVLLIACANIASLLLTRGAGRQKEIAARMAFGAGRARLIRQMLTESVLLAVPGGAAGVLLAYWGAQVIITFMASGQNPIDLVVSPDPRVLGFTVAVSALTAILFGLSPALSNTRLNLTQSLKESPGKLWASAASRRRSRFSPHETLVAAQVSLSLVVLIVAGLFARTLINLNNLNLGFNRGSLLLFTVDPSEDGYAGERLAGFYHELKQRLAALPGVRSVSMSEYTLLGRWKDVNGITMTGFSPAAVHNTKTAMVPTNSVGPGFFENMQIPLLMGRTFGETDREGAPRVAVVNQRFVREFLGQGNPIGRRFALGIGNLHPDIEIVGVVGDAKFVEIRTEAPPTLYLPILQRVGLMGTMYFELRTAGNPMLLVPAVRRAAQELDRNLALHEVQTQEEQIDRALFQERLLVRLTGFFAVLATLLACVGIYGSVAFRASQQTHEIGIRMALGAEGRDLLRAMLWQGCRAVLIGAGFGVVGSIAITRLIQTQLFGVEPTDPLTYAAVSMAIVISAVVASYLPARQATKVDPMVALRYE